MSIFLGGGGFFEGGGLFNFFCSVEGGFFEGGFFEGGGLVRGNTVSIVEQRNVRG